MTRVSPDVLDIAEGDQIPGQDVPRETDWEGNLEIEYGRTGLKRSAGYITEEFLPQLMGRKAIKVIREMSDNDPIIGALLLAIKRLIAGADWPIEPGSNSSEDRQIAQFIEECRDDMAQSWASFVLELLSSLEYGWSWHEINWKRRLGPWYSNEENDDLHRSAFDDGKIGIADLPIRAQESWQRWIFHANGSGKVIGLVQMPAPDYQMRVIPRSKSLLFRPTVHKNNPEGRSILRNAYRPWFYKKRMEESEAIGVDRDLVGVPMAEVPEALLDAKPGTEEWKKLSAYKKLVVGIRRDERSGLVWPTRYDAKGNPLYKFSLLTSGGSRQFDTNGIITRYEARILMTVLADFLLVGHEGVGTYNMHSDKTGLFKTICDSILKLIADELNRQLIPRLLRVNGLKPRLLPKFRPTSVDNPNLTELAAFMQGMAALGVTWFPDPKMEKYIRTAADLPQLDPEVEEVLEIQHQQATVMQLAQQRLQALQIGQQAATGEMQLQQTQMGMQQQALGVEQQRRELVKPGSTQPPQQGQTRPPARKAIQARPGRKAGDSNKPQPRVKAGAGR